LATVLAYLRDRTKEAPTPNYSGLQHQGKPTKA
jgi:hypothetical protein